MLKISNIKSMPECFGAEKILLLGSYLEMPEEEANDTDLVVYKYIKVHRPKLIERIAKG